jgi:hypothetical protein
MFDDFAAQRRIFGDYAIHVDAGRTSESPCRRELNFFFVEVFIVTSLLYLFALYFSVIHTANDNVRLLCEFDRIFFQNLMRIRFLEMASCENKQVYYISSEDENSTSFKSSNAAPSSDCNVDSKSNIFKTCKSEPTDAEICGDQIVQQNIITTAFCNGKLVHKCNVCFFQNEDHAEVVRHFQSKHDDQLCNQSNTSATVTKTPDSFKCNDCPFQTLYQNSFERHRSHHEIAYPLRCSRCSYSSTTVTGVRKHSIIAHKAGLKRFSSRVRCEPSESSNVDTETLRGLGVFPCLHCRSSYSRNYDLKRHLQLVHGIAAGPYQCTTCCISYASHPTFVNHMSTKHGDSSSKDQPLSVGMTSNRKAVPSPSQKTSSSGIFAQHVPPVNSTNVAAGTDEVNSASVPRTRRGRTHPWTIASKVSESQRCGRCLFRTKYPHVLSRHVQNIHRNIRPFKCTVCGHRTNEKYSMKRHLRVVHQSLEAAEYVELSTKQAMHTVGDYMSIVGRKPSSLSKLSAAKIWKTSVERKLKVVGVITNIPAEDTGDTSAAGRVSAPDTHGIDDSSSLDLNNNQTTEGIKVLDPDGRISSHTRESNMYVMENEAGQLLECAICPMTFSTAAALCQHVITHKDLRRYRCLTCGWRSNRTENMQEHVNRIHANMTSFDRLSVEEAVKTIKSYKKQFPPLRNTCLQQKEPHFTIVKQSGGEQDFSMSSRRSTSGEVEGIFVCNVCFFKFSNEESLRRHVVVHADVRRYQCLLCGLRSNFEQTIKNHLTNVHGMVVADALYRQLSIEEATSTIDFYKLNFPWHVDACAKMLNSDESTDKRGVFVTQRGADSAGNEYSGVDSRRRSSLASASTPAGHGESYRQLFTTPADIATVDGYRWSKNVGTALRKYGRNQLLLKCVSCNFRTRWRVILRRHQNIIHKSVQEAVDCQPLNVLSEEGQCNDKGRSSHPNQSDAMNEDRQEFCSSSSKHDHIVGQTESTLTTGNVHPSNTVEDMSRKPMALDRLKLRRFTCSICGYRSNVRSHVLRHQLSIHSGLGRVNMMSEGEAQKTLKHYEVTRGRRGRPGRWTLSIPSHETSVASGNMSGDPDMDGRKTVLTNSVGNDANLIAAECSDERSRSSLPKRSSHSSELNSDAEADVSNSTIRRPRYRPGRRDALANLRRFKCSKCEFRTNWDASFYAHRKKRHANSDARLVILSVAEAKAANDSGMTNVRTFGVSCCDCSYQAFSFLDLKRHSKQMHNSAVEKIQGRGRKCGGHSRSTNVPRFKCSLCSFRSHYSSSVYNHRRRCHQLALFIPLSPTATATTSHSVDVGRNCCKEDLSQSRFNQRKRQVQHRSMFHCSQCDFATKWINSLTRHVANRHPVADSVTETEVQVHSNHSCSSVSADVMVKEDASSAPKSNVDNNSCIRMQDDSFACRYCSKRSFYRHSILLHQKSKHPETLAKITVKGITPLVEERLGMSTELHMENVDAGQVDSVVSGECPLQADSANSCLSPEYRSTVVIHGASTLTGLKTEVLPATALDTAMSGASQSQITAHSITTTWLLCSQCPFVTMFSDSLLAHRQFHSSRASATVKCSLCSYSCSNHDELEKHAEVHERNYIERRTLKRWCSVPAKTHFPARAFSLSSILACGMCPFLTHHSFPLHQSQTAASSRVQRLLSDASCVLSVLVSREQASSTMRYTSLST